jgi:hypothetical protein
LTVPPEIDGPKAAVPQIADLETADIVRRASALARA